MKIEDLWYPVGLNQTEFINYSIYNLQYSILDHLHRGSAAPDYLR